MTAAFAVADARAGDAALVGDLAAGLGVERGAVENQLDAVGAVLAVVRDDRHPLAVDEDAENPCLGGQFVEAGELGRAGVDQFAVGGQVGVRLLAGGGVGLGALALLGHQAAEAFFVDAQAGLGGHLEGQLDRETVGVVQRERVGAGQHRGAGRLGRAGRLVEQPRARRQRAVERGLLGDRDALDPVEVGDQFRVRRAHRVAHRRHQLADDRVSMPSSFADRMMRRSRRRST